MVFCGRWGGVGHLTLLGHSTLRPSVTQYVFMWCWRSSLENPDPQRFLEELEALL